MSALRIVSVTSAQASVAGDAWSVRSPSFDVRVVLAGTGTVTVSLKVTDSQGAHVHSDEQVHTLEGSRLELTFAGVGELKAADGYTLTLEVTGQGIRQRQQIAVRRG